MAEVTFSTDLEDGGTVALPPPAAEISPSTMPALESLEVAAIASEPVDHSLLPAAEIGATAQSATVNPAVAELCIPLSKADPCGPDLDVEGDADYLNFFAQTEGLLPSTFFSSDDGKPFDRSAIDLPGQVDAIAPLWERTRDLRLLVVRARLLILDRDLGGFAVAVAAIAR